MVSGNLSHPHGNMSDPDVFTGQLRFFPKLMSLKICPLHPIPFVLWAWLGGPLGTAGPGRNQEYWRANWDAVVGEKKGEGESEAVQGG